MCAIVGISGKFYVDYKINKSLEDFKTYLSNEFADKKVFNNKDIVNNCSNPIHKLFLKESLRKYRYVLNKNYDTPKDYVNKYPNRIWVFWDSGFENAPKIVKICLESIEKYSSERIVEKLDMNNITKYIDLPEYILQKFKEGKINKAVFADIVRTVLLRDHGGTWIDATTYLSGDIPQYVFDSEFFVPIVSKSFCLSNLTPHTIFNCCFMSSCQTKFYIFEIMANFFFEYWKKNNRSDYHLYSSFSSIAFEEDPVFYDIIKRTYKQGIEEGKFWSLNNVLNKPFNQSDWNKVKSFPIHKMSAYHFSKLKIKPGTFADKLLKGELN